MGGMVPSGRAGHSMVSHSFATSNNPRLETVRGGSLLFSGLLIDLEGMLTAFSDTICHLGTMKEAALRERIQHPQRKAKKKAEKEPMFFQNFFSFFFFYFLE